MSQTTSTGRSAPDLDPSADWNRLLIDGEWLHVTLLPVVNVLGALAYFEDRRRTLGDRSDEPVDESA